MPWSVAVGAAVNYGMNSGKQHKADAQANAQENALKAQTGAIYSQQQLAEKQMEMSQELWDRYKKAYDTSYADAKNLDSSENQEIAAGRAHADNSAAYERQRQDALDRLRSMGVNPSSEKFINANYQFAGNEGASDAGAQYAARENLKDRGRAVRAAFAGVNYANSAVGAGNSAMNGNQGAISGFGSNASGYGTLGNTTYGRDRAETNAANSFLSPFVGKLSNWASNGVKDWWSGGNNNNATADYSGMNSGMTAGWETGSQGSGMGGFDAGSMDMSAMGDMGAMAMKDGGIVRGPRRGMRYADGGEVEQPTDDGFVPPNRGVPTGTVSGGSRLYSSGGQVNGPGTGTSDSVAVAVKGPGGVARGYLSDGEFVIPSDVVQAKGTEFFNKLIETYHTPVIQRRGVRR